MNLRELIECVYEEVRVDVFLEEDDAGETWSSAYARASGRCGDVKQMLNDRVMQMNVREISVNAAAESLAVRLRDTDGQEAGEAPRELDDAIELIEAFDYCHYCPRGSDDCADSCTTTITHEAILAMLKDIREKRGNGQ